MAMDETVDGLAAWFRTLEFGFISYEFVQDQNHHLKGIKHSLGVLVESGFLIEDDGQYRISEKVEPAFIEEPESDPVNDALDKLAEALSGGVARNYELADHLTKVHTLDRLGMILDDDIEDVLKGIAKDLGMLNEILRSIPGHTLKAIDDIFLIMKAKDPKSYKLFCVTSESEEHMKRIWYAAFSDVDGKDLIAVVDKHFTKSKVMPEAHKIKAMLAF
jgi:hypothetical protein